MLSGTALLGSLPAGNHGGWRSLGPPTASAPAIGLRAAAPPLHHPPRHPILASLSSAAVSYCPWLTWGCDPNPHSFLLRPQWWHLSPRGHVGREIRRYWAFPLCSITALLQLRPALASLRCSPRSAKLLSDWLGSSAPQSICSRTLPSFVCSAA